VDSFADLEANQVLEEVDLGEELEFRWVVFGGLNVVAEEEAEVGAFQQNGVDLQGG
jgi:hypothetical protein